MISVVEQVAPTRASVLLTGESGTGKEVIASQLHHLSPRRSQPFIKINCAALPEQLLESELFGHERGAFTGASSPKIGLLEAADGGTVFLDEIGELPLEIQPKLLRLLEEKTYERVGDPRELRANVRIIAATNRDLESEVQAGRFRRDLYGRLNYFPIRVPPLRDRREDIGLLLRYHLDQTESGRWIEVSDEAIRHLVQLDTSWPDNVRQIRQLAARLAVEGGSGPVGPETVERLLGMRREPARLAVPAVSGQPGGAAGTTDAVTRVELDLDVDLPTFRDDAERAYLAAKLRRHAGLTRAELAAKLGIGEATLFKKLRQHGLGG